MLAISDDTSRWMVEGQDRAGVRLSAGWNQVLVKVAQRQGLWAARLRMTDLRGAVLPGLTLSTENQDAAVANLTEQWPPAPEDPILALLATERGPVVAYLTAWRLHGLGVARSARLAFEALVTSQPGCAICLQGLASAALADEDRDRALTALSAALEIDPGFVRAAIDRARIHQGMGLDASAEDDAKRSLMASPEDSEALALLAQIRLGHGFSIEGRRLADGADAALPGWCTYIILRAEAALALGDQAAAEALLIQARKANAMDWGPGLRLFDLFHRQGRLEEAARVYEKWLTQDPNSSEARQNVFTVRMEAGQDALAKAQIAELRRQNPDSPLSFRLEGDLCERRADPSCAIAAYRRSLTLNPADWGLRDHLEILAPSHDSLSRFQVTSTEVRRRARGTLASNYPGANAVVLLREETYVLHDDGSLGGRMHFAVQVFDQSGIDQYLNFQVGKPSHLKLKLAGTVDEDGLFHEVSSVDDGKVHFPLARPGSTFEIIYTWDAIPSSMSDWWSSFNFQDSAPAIEQRWIVAHPATRPLKTWKRGDRIEESRESLSDTSLVIFDAKDEPQLPSEPDAAPLESFRDMAFVSTFSSWDQVVRWQRASVDHQLQLDVADPVVKELAATLTKGASTADAKIAALASYVRREVHYNRADTNIYRWRAHPARRILETHYGDCKDKSTLFQALASNVGLQTENAFLLSSYDGRTPTQIPTLWFNHAVAYLPPQAGLSRPGPVDLTDDEIGSGFVPFGIQSANAVVFKPGTPAWRFEQIPFSPPQDHALHFSMSMKLDPKGETLAEIKMRAHGISAEEYRRGYRSAQHRAQVLDEIAGLLVPGGARVGTEAVSGLNDLDMDLDVEMQVTGPSSLRPMGDAWLVKIAGMPDVSGFTRQTSRVTPLRWGAATELDVDQEIEIPLNLRVGRLPDNVRLDGPFFRFELTAKRRGDHTILIAMRYQRKTAEISPKEFQAFRDAAVQVQRATEVTLALRTAPPKGPGAK
jgi:tetratricopeptide (TPR) repeat protein/transglutaminase-like putative cysteine protease